MARRAVESTHRISGDATLAERGIFAALGPHATDTVSDDLWRRVVLAATENGFPCTLM